MTPGDIYTADKTLVKVVEDTKTTVYLLEEPKYFHTPHTPVVTLGTQSN